MRKSLLICLFLFAHFAYGSMIDVPYISKVTQTSHWDCGQASPAALCYKVSWESYPTNIDGSVIEPIDYKYNIYVRQYHRGTNAFYGWDTSNMPKPISPNQDHRYAGWGEVLSAWHNMNGASGTGYIHLNSGNEGMGIGCFQFGGIKSGWFSSDYITLPGTSCRIIPPPQNQCEITTKTNNEFNFDFGNQQGGKLDGASLTIPFSLNCSLPTTVTAYLITASNEIPLKGNGDNSQLYTTMSLDNMKFEDDGSLNFDINQLTSDHTLTATLHETAGKIESGDYSGSSALVIAID